MDDDFEHVNCNLCNENKYETVSSIGQFGLPAHVVVCRTCGLTYLNPRWTKQRYLDFYVNEYDNYYRPNINTALIETGEPILARLKSLKSADPEFSFSEPKKILDIGSGAGANLNFFKRIYPDSELSAIEPSDNAVRILQKNQVEILSRDIDSNWQEQRKSQFDLIIMRHVLEHFSNPVETLTKVRESLSENGVLYIGVPNNMKPKGDLEAFWFRAVHTYYYSSDTLRGLLCKSGMSPIQICEGDHFSPNELFAFVKKGANNLPIEFDSSNFDKQILVFDQHRRQQNSWVRKIKISLGRFKHKLATLGHSSKN